MALAHSTPPHNPYIRGGNPKTRGRSPNFQNTEKLHASYLALAHSTSPLPASPILGVATLKHGGGALIFKTPKNFMHFGTLGTYIFFSFFDIFQPRAPLERPLTTHERGRRTPTATTRIAFRLAWCPSWCIFRRCGRLWVGLFPLSHPLATSFKLPGGEQHNTGSMVVLHRCRSIAAVSVWHQYAAGIPSIPHFC